MGACQSNSPLHIESKCRTTGFAADSKPEDGQRHNVNGDVPMETFVPNVEDLSELPISVMLSFLSAQDLSSVQDLSNKSLYVLAEKELVKRDKEIKRLHKHESCASTCRDRVLRWEMAQNFVQDLEGEASQRRAKQNNFWTGCRDNAQVEDVSAPIRTNPSVEVFIRISLANAPEAEPQYQGFVPILEDPKHDDEVMEFYTYIAVSIYGLQLDMKTRKSLRAMSSRTARYRLERLFEAIKTPEDTQKVDDIEINITKITQCDCSKNVCKQNLLVSTSGIQLTTGSGGAVFCYFLNHKNTHRDKGGVDSVTPLFFFEGKVPQSLSSLIERAIRPSDQAPVMF